MKPEAEIAMWAVGLLVAVAGAYFAYLTIQPRGRLEVRSTATALVTRHEAPGIAERLTIQHSEHGALANPVLVKVALSNLGRNDIGPSHFVSDQSLRLDLGAPILEKLEIVSNRPGQVLPEVRASSGELEIMPGLISRGQEVVIACLIDGTSKVRVAQRALRDVDLTGRAPERRDPRVPLVVGSVCLLLFGAWQLARRVAPEDALPMVDSVWAASLLVVSIFSTHVLWRRAERENRANIGL
jgi:hypothetical protein